MARGDGRQADRRLREAIDVSLDRLRRGEDLERCLSAYPDLATDLRPILELSASLLADRVIPPPPAGELAAGRQEFLRIAEALRTTPDSSAAEEPSASDLDLFEGALQRLQAGESLDAVLEDLPAAEDMRPLISLAAEALAERVAPPPPPQGLARAAQRFEAAVELLTSNADPEPEQQYSADGATEAIADGVDRILSGESPADVLTDYPELAADIDPVLSLAAGLVADTVNAPPPPSGLARARQRFVAAADAARASAGVTVDGSAAARQPGMAPSIPGLAQSLVDGLTEFLSPSRRAPALRLAAITASVVAFLAVWSVAVAPAVEAAIPGDALYPVKRIGEGVQLLAAGGPERRQELEARFSARRATEIEELGHVGRSAEVTWQVELVDLEVDSGAAEAGVRRLVILALGEADHDQERFEILVDDQTAFDLGDRFDDIGQVPPGSRLTVVVRTQPDHPERLPLAMSVALTELPRSSSPLIPATSMPPTAVSRRTTSVPPTLPATPALTPTLARPTITPTAVAASPTPTTMATAVGPIRPGPAGEATVDASRGLLRGVVEEKPSEASWVIADFDQGGRLVRVDVSNLAATEKELAKRSDGVDLWGRWLSADHGLFEAWEILEHIPQAKLCKPQEVSGAVVAYEPGAYVLLTDRRQFAMRGVDSSAVGGVAPLAVGAYVTVYYLDCRGIEHVTRIHVVRGASEPARATGTAPPPDVPYQGVVMNVVDTGSFWMLGDDGREYLIIHGPDVPITGAASRIKWNQEVGVYGWLEDNKITAHHIEVYVDAPPTATPQITPTPTSAVGEPGYIVTPPSVPTVGPPGEGTQ